jgi:hypothetical protein
MGYLFRSLVLMFFLGFFTVCENQNNPTENKELIAIDTDKLFEIEKPSDYLENNSYYKELYNEAYIAIKTLNFDSAFFSNLRYGNNEKGLSSVYVSTFITGLIYEEEKIYDAVLLFYMKFYLAFLNGEPYCSRILSDMGENSYTPVFYMIFIKLSGHKPDNFMLASTVYDWIITKPEYLKNEDINSIIEEIKHKQKNDK